MVELLVTKMNYNINRAQILVDIHGRDEFGVRRKYVLMGAEPYFYVPEKPKNHVLIKRMEQKGKDLLNKPLWKVYTRLPMDVKELRSKFEYHYEADIPFTDRVRFDYGIKTQIEVPDERRAITREDIKPVERTITPETVFIDIETDDSKGFAHSDYSAYPVVSVAMYSTQYDKYFMIIIGKVDKKKIRKNFKKMGCNIEVVIKMVENEKLLFRMLQKLLRGINPDIITGWNVDGYDIRYLENRSQNMHFARPEFRKFSVFDLMGGYARLHKGKAFLKLEYVAQKELGTGKLKREKIHVMMKEDKEKLCVYNLWDVELTRLINNVKNIVNFHLNLSWFAGCDMEKSAFNEPLVDKYILHEVNGIVVTPSKEMIKTGGVDKGAFVDNPVSGKYKYVGMIDFASMYPRNIISTNLSSETKVDSDEGIEVFKLPSGRMYKKKPKGLLPHVVENLIAFRDNVKDEMLQHKKGSKEHTSLWEQQRAIKYFTNAVYGVMGSRIFRLADGDVASDITHMGRFLIQYTIDEVAKMGYVPLYGDTDSIFFETGKDNIEDAVKVAKKVEKNLNKLYPVLAETWNGRKECVHSIRCEKVYESWVQSGAKKRHIGLVGWDDDTEEKFIGDIPIKDRLDIKGFEMVRSNVASLTKKLQEYVLITALEKDDYEKLISKYLIYLRQKFYKGELDKELLIPASFSRSKYEVVPAHHRALRYSRDEDILEIQPGDPYSWLYVRRVEGHMLTDVVALEFDLDEFPDDVKIDYDRMWERCVAKPLDLILESLNMDLEMVLAGQKQASVMDF